MCKCTCRRGEQGPQGPAGTSNINNVRITNTPVPSATDLSIIASAAQAGNLLLFGQLSFSSNAAINYQTTIFVNGLPATSSLSCYGTGAPVVTLTSTVTLPVSDIVSVGAGDTVEIRVILSDYTRATDVQGTIQFAYQ